MQTLCSGLWRVAKEKKKDTNKSLLGVFSITLYCFKASSIFEINEDLIMAKPNQQKNQMLNYPAVDKPIQRTSVIYHLKKLALSQISKLYILDSRGWLWETKRMPIQTKISNQLFLVHMILVQSQPLRTLNLNYLQEKQTRT